MNTLYIQKVMNRSLWFVLMVLAAAGPCFAGRTYWVDGPNPAAADANPGTEAAPWKTLAHAGKAAVLQPGDTVFVKSGV